jgi:DNA-binding NarL/FixJ family response regulator
MTDLGFDRQSSPPEDPIVNSLRVAVVEDQTQIRDGLRFLIDGTPGFQCTAAFATMEDALATIAPANTDVALVDIGLPGLSGIDGIRILKARHPELRLIALTVFDDDERVFQALCAGASGYLLKKTPPARLLDALRDADSGGSPLSPEVATRVIALFRDARLPEASGHGLTPHEVRLLGLLAEGHGYKTAAATLDCSVHTVAFHMRNIYAKLQVHSKSEAVAKALRQRIVR